MAAPDPDPVVLEACALDIAFADILAGLVHALRNPLQAVSYAVPQLAEGVRDAQLADMATTGTERTLDVVHDLGALADLRAAPQPALVSIPDVVSLTCRLQTYRRPRFGGRVESKVDDNLPVVFASRYAAVAALSMLISNAKDACPEGGTVTVRATLDDGGVAIDVNDPGPGTRTATPHDLFSPGWTTRPDRSGLGLPACRALAQRANGRVELRSGAPGETTFRLWFPPGIPA